MLGIVCSTIEEANALDAKMLAGLVADFGTIADRANRVIIHPVVSSSIAELVEPCCLKYLSPAEQKMVVTLGADWFPTDEN